MVQKIWEDNEVEILSVPADQFKFLKNNPHYMPREMFNRLVENIRRDGKLTSVPLCVKEGNEYVVLSGNHRVRAGIKAGLEKIVVLNYKKHLTDSQKKAIAISHNSINGFDDPMLLKKMYDEIDDVIEKEYAGIDLQHVKEMFEKVSVRSPWKSVSVNMQDIHILFIEDDKEIMEELIKEAEIKLGEEEVYCFPMSEYQSFLERIDHARSSLNIKHTGLALVTLMQLGTKYLEGEVDGTTEEEN